MPNIMQIFCTHRSRPVPAAMTWTLIWPAPDSRLRVRGTRAHRPVPARAGHVRCVQIPRSAPGTRGRRADDAGTADI